MEHSSGSVNAWIVRLLFMFAQFVFLFLQSDFLIWCPRHLLLLFWSRSSDSPPSCCCTAVWCSPCSSLGNEREMALWSPAAQLRFKHLDTAEMMADLTPSQALPVQMGSVMWPSWTESFAGTRLLERSIVQQNSQREHYNCVPAAFSEVISGRETKKKRTEKTTALWAP